MGDRGRGWEGMGRRRKGVRVWEKRGGRRVIEGGKGGGEEGRTGWEGREEGGEEWERVWE